jgi:glycosyltransferase involved in cell wall biosynthesis
MTFLTPSRRYNIVHVTSPPDVMVFTAVVPRLFGARIILDIHDIGPELFMRKMHVGENQIIIRVLKVLERLSASFADHVITVTDFWRDRLVARSVDPSKVTLLLNVPDSELFRPARIRPVKSSFNLFYHGSVEEHFGLDTLLLAMPEIKAHIPNVLLHLYCGKKGRVYAECAALAKRLDLNSYVMFHAGVPFYELPRTLSSADIGVVPTKDSVFSNEAVSMKALEYIALEIPIVISKTMAHEFYYDSSMVRFFEPCNSGQLAQAVIELHDSREKRESLVRNASAFLKERGWDASKEIYSSVVSRLMAQR